MAARCSTRTTRRRLDARIDAAARSATSTRRWAACQGERAVLELVAIDELSLAEAAAAAGIRPVTARVRLHRARRKLRTELAAAAVDHPDQGGQIVTEKQTPGDDFEGDSSTS